jgi:hypothetical protein
VTSTLTTLPTAHRRGPGRQVGGPARHRRTPARRERTRRDQRVLGQYTDRDGQAREVIAHHGAAGSTLVIDRQRGTQGDPRLVAHVAADEPAENAAVVCRSYLRDVAVGAGRCRLVTPEDMDIAPFVDQWALDPHDAIEADVSAPASAVDRRGRSYALELFSSHMSIPELRWCRRAHPLVPEVEPVSMREAIASLDSYEPVRTLTWSALSRHRHGTEVSTSVLRAELARVQASPIVLNRALREAVQQAVEREELSMSEIAIRCGRIKRDRKGNEAGETSWLARRIGLLPEGGRDTPTPWIHSDVLALIARHGLGISPREVEL